MKHKVEERLDNDQFGFRKGKEMQEAIIALRQLLERRVDVNIATFIAFVNLEKAFDKVDWELLFNTLREAGVDLKDRRLILNLYKGQITEIDVKGNKREAKIRQGVRQGCPLFPYLINLFIEHTINEMKDHSRGLSINGKQFHSIHLADDIALLADSEEELNLMLHILDSSIDKFKLNINSKKTKVIVM